MLTSTLIQDLRTLNTFTPALQCRLRLIHIYVYQNILQTTETPKSENSFAIDHFAAVIIRNTPSAAWPNIYATKN